MLVIFMSDPEERRVIYDAAKALVAELEVGSVPEPGPLGCRHGRSRQESEAAVDNPAPIKPLLRRR